MYHNRKIMNAKHTKRLDHYTEMLYILLV